MKKIVIFLLTLFGLNDSAWAQKDILQKIVPLNVGDTVPDLVFRQMVNYPDSVAKLSDFEGKAVLIDFWASWCFPCMAAFPKLEKLKEKYPDDLQVMLISSDEQEVVKQVYSRRKGLSLPSAISHNQADTIQQLFPHRVIPHSVWIDKDRRVYAITDGTNLTEKAVDNWMKGGKSDLPRKNEVEELNRNVTGTVIDSIVSDGMKTEISWDSTILYQSVFRKYDPRLTNHRRYAPWNRFMIDFPNSIPGIMVYVANGFDSREQRARIIYDVDNEDLYKSPAIVSEEWNEVNRYGYRLIMPKPDSALAANIMQREFERMFGLWAYTQQTKVPCLVLRVNGDTSKLRQPNPGGPRSSTSLYHVELVNQPVSKLIYLLQVLVKAPHRLKGQEYGSIIVDETGIEGLINLSLTDIPNTKDLGLLNKALDSVGLELVPDTREFEILFITDKPREQVLTQNSIR